MSLFSCIEGSKILIVDDNQDNIKLVGEILSIYKPKISIANNGINAVNTAKQIIPDIILMDVNMPEMNGYQACKLLKVNPATMNIPVIFLTARSETSDIAQGYEVGGSDYILKPINQLELLNKIDTQLLLVKYLIEKVKIY